MDVKYTSWPLGQIPEHLQRPELRQLKEAGYAFNDPRDVVTLFENKVAEFAGSKYAVAVDCASHGLFLCLKLLKAKGEITIPQNTYCSVPQQIINAGCTPVLEYLEWSGVYQLKPYPIYDGAVRWKRGMFNGFLHVVSFQIKKMIPVGKMGVILLDDYEMCKKLKLMSYDGRDLTLPYFDINHIKCLGYHMYATPEDCARAIILMDSINNQGDSGNYNSYPDLTAWLNKMTQ